MHKYVFIFLLSFHKTNEQNCLWNFPRMNWQAFSIFLSVIGMSVNLLFHIRNFSIAFLSGPLSDFGTRAQYGPAFVQPWVIMLHLGKGHKSIIHQKFPKTNIQYINGLQTWGQKEKVSKQALIWQQRIVSQSYKILFCLQEYKIWSFIFNEYYPFNYIIWCFCI